MMTTRVMRAYRDERGWRRFRLAGTALLACAAGGMSGCAPAPHAGAGHTQDGRFSTAQFANAAAVSRQLVAAPLDRSDLGRLNRLTWGESSSAAAVYGRVGRAAFEAYQLHPSNDLGMPAAINAQIAEMTISREALPSLLSEMRTQRDALKTIDDPEQKKAAQQAYQRSMNELAREAAMRSLLRDVYAQDQLKEQLVWFWFNHFNVSQNKADIRVLVGDYEEHAIRPHALGRFHDLLDAVLHHPAMLENLDNDHNVANHLNENYAREIMELHTMGVGGGYTQNDVQELARILTGVGVNETDKSPNIAPQHRSDYVREGMFEFNPNRHDYGTRHFLGHTLSGGGMREVEEAIDLIVRSPATARNISRALATAFVSDNPPSALVDRMAARFRETDGNIAEVMRTMLDAPEFEASLGKKFKDPVHYAVSAVRLAYDTRPIVTPAPILNWLYRMGEPLYGRDTPDGFPLTDAAWSSPGQMATRFELARGIGGSSAGLFREAGQDADRPAFPELQNALYFTSIEATLPGATRSTLDQAGSPQNWNMLFLSSPDFMRR